MGAKNIVVGQKVDDAHRARARELRRAMTREEALLWQHLRGNRLGGLHFRRQQVIDGFIVDFYCHAAALVVEVDGPVHQNQREYDRERDAVLADRGLHLLRVTNEEVASDLARVLKCIASAAAGERT